jgi:hypothetical protein
LEQIVYAWDIHVKGFMAPLIQNIINIVEIPAAALWLYRNKEALQSVQRGLRDAAEGKITKPNLDEL